MEALKEVHHSCERGCCRSPEKRRGRALFQQTPALNNQLVATAGDRAFGERIVVEVMDDKKKICIKS